MRERLSRSATGAHVIGRAAMAHGYINPLWSTSYHAWIMRRPHNVVRH